MFLKLMIYKQQFVYSDWLRTCEVKNINLSLNELKYAGADRDGFTKYQLKK